MKNPHLFAAHEDDSACRPHLPLFSSWRGVYLAVVICFVVYVVALTVFTRVYA